MGPDTVEHLARSAKGSCLIEQTDETQQPRHRRVDGLQYRRTTCNNCKGSCFAESRASLGPRRLDGVVADTEALDSSGDERRRCASVLIDGPRVNNNWDFLSLSGRQHRIAVGGALETPRPSCENHGGICRPECHAGVLIHATRLGNRSWDFLKLSANQNQTAAGGALEATTRSKFGRSSLAASVHRASQILRPEEKG
jgi:hypothetical protein